ncbi:MAG: hypothetical protein IKE85_00130 [Mogibacterium sp.]|nr:hypothetical protein [Mogibacterium sp.]
MLKKISAIAMSLIMFVSMSEFALMEVFAEDASGQTETELAKDAGMTQAQAEGSSEQADANAAADETASAEASAADSDAGNVEAAEQVAAEQAAEATEEATADEEVPEELSLEAIQETLTYQTNEAALEGSEEPPEEEPATIEKRYLQSQHIATPIQQMTSYGADLELRTLIGEPSDGHAVLQGAATDGVYAYCMMTCSATQQGRIVKLLVGSNEIAGVSGILDIHHGNGMTYDSKRHCLVVVGAAGRRQQLTYIDANSLICTGYRNVAYSNYKGTDHPFAQGHQKSGLKNIAYNAEYDCYIAAERNEYSNVSGDNYNLMFFNAEPDENGNLQAIGFAYSDIYAKYKKVYQAIDVDDQYVYYLLSKSGNQKNNMFVATEYHPEKLDPIKNGEVEFIAEPWNCGATENKEIDAVVTINTNYEVEGLYHVTDPATGENHFYMTEYNKDIRTKTISKKVKYKKKWKKVWKKVKWKKVKKKGKWKWKYKKKKVWKYKTKYKTVKEKVQYYYRQDHIFDLGVIAKDVKEIPAPIDIPDDGGDDGEEDEGTETPLNP